MPEHPPEYSRSELPVLTQAPLPTWLNLFRALLRRPPSDADLAKPWRSEGAVAGWLSRSAWSLALIALWRKSRAPASPVTVWIPDFFCNASLAVLRWTGARLVFYPVSVEMAPDFAACRILADAEPPDMFVLVHYFGQPAPATATRDFCTRHGAWLIEDAVHVLRPVNGIGAYGDCVLYSLHKHLPIPDGAVLVVRPNGPGKFGEDGLASFGLPSSWPSQLRELQHQLGCSESSGQAHAVIWLVKRVLQKLGVHSWRRSMTPFAEPLNLRHTASIQLSAPSLSSLARRLLAGLIFDLGVVACQRQRHQLLWDGLLIDDESCPGHLSFGARPVHREWTPYLAAYRADSATVGAIYDQWHRQSLPVTIWPDLPPEVTMHRERHANAWHLRHSRLYLPVHQSLIARRLWKACCRHKTDQESETRIRLIWDNATQEQWQRWMVQTGRSNLLQSWAYGEAKSVEGGWRARRGVFYIDSEPIAFVQVMQKRIAGLLGASRINRGPLFLRLPLPHELRAIWRQLAGLRRLWRGGVLTVAPELSLSGSSLALMERLCFRQITPYSWESVWVDLGLELDALRKGLDGKWRNMLTFSEKAGLKLEIGSDVARFDWMMARYQEMKQAKDFSGPPIELLLNLRRSCSGDDQLLILRAVHEGEMVAGICLARHGAAATYLLGWNGSKGRNLKANQYLLWQAIVHLKHSGTRWFDLGGISEDRTPGITSFKLGLNGERYTLVGEYWKW